MRGFLFAVVLLLSGCLCSAPPEPAPVQPAPVPTVKVQKKPTYPVKRCVFSDGIRGCVYNDKLLRKEGHGKYKPYGSAEVKSK